MEARRKELKNGDHEELIIAFEWCHDEELPTSRIFPGFWGCDTTFGVTKAQRHLFLFACIDGNNKVFTLFHCFMPSKEASAYHWAL